MARQRAQRSRGPSNTLFHVVFCRVLTPAVLLGPTAVPCRYRNSLYSGTYVSSSDAETNDSGGAGELAAALLATAVVLLPLAFVGYRILLRS